MPSPASSTPNCSNLATLPRYASPQPPSRASSDSTSGGDSLAGYLVEEAEASGDDASFTSDGSSAGGNRGFVPDGGHESLDGLVPAVDEVLCPSPDDGE